MLKIIDEKFPNVCSDSDKLTLLRGMDSFRLFQKPDNKVLERVLTRTSQGLEQKKTRCDNLMLLHTFLGQCPNDVFQKWAVEWTRKVMQIVKSHTNKNAWIVLKTLLSNASKFPALRKEIGEKLFTQLIPDLIDKFSGDQWVKYASDCLAICMKGMPIYCIPFQKNIFNCLWSQLNSGDNKNIKSVSQCYIHLPLIFQKGNNEGHYADVWSQLLDKLLHSLHASINSLYRDLPCARKQVDVPPDVLFDEPEEEFAKIMFHTRKFQALAQCLIAMLQTATKFPVVPPTLHILDVVNRAFDVTFEKMLSMKRLVFFAVEPVLPLIHTSALKILETSLIIGSRAQLRSLEGVIMNLLFSCLRTQYTIHKGIPTLVECSTLRHIAYRTLNYWFGRYRMSSTISDYAEHLHMEILADIVYQPTDMEEPSYQCNTENADIFDAASYTSTEHTENVRVALCTEALSLLGTLCTSKFIKDDLRTSLQKALVSVITSVQESGTVPHLYSNDKCRLQLYKTLLHVTTGSFLTKPLSVARTLFELGNKDTSFEISKFCYEASKICTVFVQQRMVHPTEQRLYDEDSVTGYRASVHSHPNRANVQHHDTHDGSSSYHHHQQQQRGSNCPADDSTGIQICHVQSQVEPKPMEVSMYEEVYDDDEEEEEDNDVEEEEDIDEEYDNDIEEEDEEGIEEEEDAVEEEEEVEEVDEDDEIEELDDSPREHEFKANDTKNPPLEHDEAEHGVEDVEDNEKYEVAVKKQKMSCKDDDEVQDQQDMVFMEDDHPSPTFESTQKSVEFQQLDAKDIDKIEEVLDYEADQMDEDDGGSGAGSGLLRQEKHSISSTETLRDSGDETINESPVKDVGDPDVNGLETGRSRKNGPSGDESEITPKIRNIVPYKEDSSSDQERTEVTSTLPVKTESDDACWEELAQSFQDVPAEN